MPLIDAGGSTIGLVNAAQVNSGPVTTYTYDPSGTPSVSGPANNWPFLAGGGEHEGTDPASVYYAGNGQFYDPQIQSCLSQTSATGLSQLSLGACGGGEFSPAGNAIATRPTHASAAIDGRPTRIMRVYCRNNSDSVGGA